jgi:hypothetical protein
MGKIPWPQGCLSNSISFLYAVKAWQIGIYFLLDFRSFSTMIPEIQQLRDLRASVALPSSFTKDMENLKSWGFKLPTLREVEMAFYH